MREGYFWILFVTVLVVHWLSEHHRNKLADMLGRTLDRLERIESQLEDISQ